MQFFRKTYDFRSNWKNIGSVVSIFNGILTDFDEILYWSQ